jgi:hypothetical protein
MIQLDRSLRRLGESVPTPKEEKCIQMWRNIVTELHLRRLNPSKKRIWPWVLLSSVLLFIIFNSALREAFVFWLIKGSPSTTQIMNKYVHSVDTPTVGYLSNIVVRNGDLNLYLQTTGSKLWVENLKTGQIWHSQADTEGISINGSRSIDFTNNLFYLSYVNHAQQITRMVLPYEDLTSINYYPFDSGIGVQYNFADHMFSIRINWHLGPDYIDIEIPNNSIISVGDLQIEKIALIPFLAAFAPIDDLGRIGTDGTSLDVTTALQTLNKYEGDYFAMVLNGADQAVFRFPDDSGVTKKAYVEFDLSAKGQGIPEKGFKVRYYLPFDQSFSPNRSDLFQKEVFIYRPKLNLDQMLLPMVNTYRLI